MKRVFLTVITITLLSGLYVYQHARLIEYSYSINNSKEDLLLLIDRNRALRYNVSKLESPARLEEAVVDRTDVKAYTALDCYRVKVKEPVVPDDSAVLPAPMSSIGKMMFSMFSFGSEAVAEELKQ